MPKSSSDKTYRTGWIHFSCSSLENLIPGKFGISLLRGGDKHFVEGPGLYPHDRLIEVNGENVEGATNDRIYELFEVIHHPQLYRRISVLLEIL